MFALEEMTFISVLDDVVIFSFFKHLYISLSHIIHALNHAPMPNYYTDHHQISRVIDR